MRQQRPPVSEDKDMKALKVLAAAIPASFLPVFAYNLGAGQDPVWHPVGLLLEIFRGKREWTSTATGVLIAEIVVLAAAAIGVLWAVKKTLGSAKVQEKRSEQRIDQYAATMTDPRDVEHTDPKALATQTRRLAPAISDTHPGHAGIVMGRTVKRNRELRMSWEWVAIAIAGSRMGKSATLAIPAMCYAPGFLLGTSNKPDIYTHTLYLRKQMGRVWLFDLQGVTTGDRRERPSFWFNPLRGVDDLPSARVVCDYFISAATDDNARVDAYFDGAARDLFGSYVLAAALVGGDLRHVVDWLRETQSQIPVQVLAQNGYPDLAATMQGKQNVNAKQRDGFYDMARRFLAPIDEPRYEETVLPNIRYTIGTGGDGRITLARGRKVHDLPELDVEQVVRSTDTVYAMSKNGPGSASAITTALVGAIGDAALEYGAQHTSGRLPIPAVMVLDEAANICKLQQLPDWYSHFGSRGIVLITILQSPSQAKKVWGETNFAVMLDACNMLWYGGNVQDREFLAALSDEIGDHHVQTESRSRDDGILGGGQSTVSTSWQREKILTVDELKALPQRRAIVTMGGAKPLLVRKNFWGDTPFADDITRSLTECAADTDRIEQKALPLGISDQSAAQDVTGPIPRIDTPTDDKPGAAPTHQVAAPAPGRSLDDIFDSEFFAEGTH
ncbi:type IV secretory system conjugative DNA transfer family protein [Rhodococcus marinonascens]|uniref:type IV secretory system conjugative DNA transfer family protein n=1 Tax=Rhodococcus marinonascens TaxID=38311 RepID=UPI001FE9BB40|nr:TraM recognition domain-containing protein [Rhodococcus marinonascens]